MDCCPNLWYVGTVKQFDQDFITACGKTEKGIQSGTLFTPSININKVLKAVLRIHDILVWIRIRGSMPLTNSPGSRSWIQILDPAPAIFVIDLQDANKKLIFIFYFICLLLFEDTFTSFCKDKN